MKRFLLLIVLLPIQLLSQNKPDSLLIADLQHQNLTVLPPDFNYSQLKALYAGYNPLKTLPQALIDATQLKLLNIHYNPLFDLESSIPILKQLKMESLLIDHCNLMYLPLEFGQIKSLKHVSFAYNHIPEIPDYIFTYSDFYSLNAEGNQIKNLPKKITSQLNLKSLDLSKNPCINDPESYKTIYYLGGLQELYVRGATFLPKEIWNLKTLEKLDISDGSCETLSLPNDADKHNLKYLLATDCDALDFKTLFPLLSGTSLKEIHLGGKGFTGFNNTALSSGITQLTISGETLSHFTIAGSLPNLEDMTLHFKSIACQAELIKTLSKFSHLSSLNLSDCHLTRLPSQLIKLEKLQTLNISGNKLSSIQELLEMTQLSLLDVSFCELSNEQLAKLKKGLPNTKILSHQASDKLPLINATVTTENFSVTPTLPQTVTTENGTTIMIPKNSLVYKDGTLVKEAVTINYTPYYSLADIANSGINMMYQTPESAAPFSSAGMFKLNANVNRKPVELKKGAEINIAFKSNDGEKSYNYYAYDTLKQRWKDIGKDTITKIKIAKPLDSAAINNSINNGSYKMPQPPATYINSGLTISWDLDKHKKLTGKFSIKKIRVSQKKSIDTNSMINYFTELNPLATVEWKIDSEKSSESVKRFLSNQTLFSTVSEGRILKLNPRFINSQTLKEKDIEFDLIPDKGHDNFIFRFYNNVDTVCFSAYPLVQDRNPDRAQKSIKKMFFKYQEMALERKKATNNRKEKFTTAYNAFKVYMKQLRAQYFKQEEANVANLLSNKINTDAYNITRVLTLQGFGIYNCDRPVQIENPIVFSPEFYTEEGKRFPSSTIQVIDPKENIAVTYYNTNNIKVSKNSVITFIYTSYHTTNNALVYVGKLSTFELNTKNGKIGVPLMLLPADATLGQLNNFINEPR